MSNLCSCTTTTTVCEKSGESDWIGFNWCCATRFRLTWLSVARQLSKERGSCSISTLGIVYLFSFFFLSSSCPESNINDQTPVKNSPWFQQFLNQSIDLTAVVSTRANLWFLSGFSVRPIRAEKREVGGLSVFDLMGISVMSEWNCYLILVVFFPFILSTKSLSRLRHLYSWIELEWAVHLIVV